MNLVFTAFFVVYGNLAVSLSGGIGGAAPKWCSGLLNAGGWDIQPSTCFPYGNKKTTKNQSVFRSKSMRTNKGILVRLTPEQKSTLDLDSKKTGISGPKLLKNAYFSSHSLIFLMPYDLASKAVLSLSQIAEQMNLLKKQALENKLEDHLSILEGISDDQKTIIRLMSMYSGSN